MQNTRVLISGASIAGPALAYWLDRYGFDVTVVEKAPGVRPGGQAVDFKGETHRTVLSRMGLLDDVRRLQTGGGGDGRIVDAAGRTIGVMPGEFSGGEIEIARGDLARLLHERTEKTCTYLFGDSIRSITQTAGGVQVTFDTAPPQDFDLVFGADGIHSNTRRLVFGPEPDHVRHLGYYYALADLDIGDDDEDAMYNEPGRMAATGGPKAPAFFVFAAEPLSYDRDDLDQQKKLLADAYRGGGWRIPELIAALPQARTFYLDAISRTVMERWTTGRVALVGDAAYGNTLGGFGTGMAVVGAYVLAGELRRAGGDHRVAFPRYEAKFRSYAQSGRKVSGGTVLAPRTRWAMRARNTLFSVSFLFKPLMRVVDRYATDIRLEDYTR
jgi:2-polyprenyl-6-methoxyphenol hydroxylase-like FAD-dependent oxidoreductase